MYVCMYVYVMYPNLTHSSSSNNDTVLRQDVVIKAWSVTVPNKWLTYACNISKTDTKTRTTKQRVLSYTRLETTSYYNKQTPWRAAKLTTSHSLCRHPLINVAQRQASSSISGSCPHNGTTYDFLKAISGQKLVVKHCWINAVAVRSDSKKLTLPAVVRQRSLALAFTTIWVMGYKSPTTVHSVGFRLGDPNTLEEIGPSSLTKQQNSMM